MAEPRRLRYLHTFIDDEAAEAATARSRSCPPPVADAADAADAADVISFVTGYVANLPGRCALNFQPPLVVPQVAPAEQAPEAEDAIEARPMAIESQEAVPAVGAEAPQQEIPSRGSRAHPFLCSRPCIRFAKGFCEAGDACGYCHHKADSKMIALLTQLDHWSQMGHWVRLQLWDVSSTWSVEETQITVQYSWDNSQL